jgi:hypothetical protein
MMDHFLANLTTQKALYYINRMTAMITTKVIVLGAGL